MSYRFFLYRLRLKFALEFKRLTHKPFASTLNPYLSEKNSPILIHCCYHKIGTVWFGRVLREVAAEFGLKFGAGTNYDQIQDFEINQNFQIFIDNGSHVNLEKIDNYVGSHMIRDPRDMIISGYFYHRWTDELWANLPRAEYRGRSYKQYLNSIDQHEGIITEIKRNWFWIPHMANWNFNNPYMFEIRYEDIIRDEESVFKKMFQHYKFKNNAVKRSCAIASKYSFKAMKKNKGTGANSHLRSGRSGEWNKYFSEEHKILFKKMYPEAVVKLGYEKDDNW